MAIIPGSVRFTGFIAPTDSTDTFPVTDPTWGLGGLRRVSGTTERDLISTGRRETGMLVFSENDDTYYKLGSGLTNSDWISFLSGSTTTQDLGQTLVIGNNTNGNDIVIDIDDIIVGPLSGSTRINLNSTIFNDPGLPVRIFNGATNTPVGLTGFAYTTQFDWTSIFSIGDKLQINGTQGGVNDGIHTITGLFFNSPVTEIQWSGMTSDTNSPYGEWARQGDGTEWIIGTLNSRINDYAELFGITTNREQLSFINTNTGGTISIGNFRQAQLNLTEHVNLTLFDNIGFTRFGEIKMVDNLSSDITTSTFAPHFPTVISSKNSTLKQSVFNTVILGGENINGKSNNTAYLNQLGYNYGGLSETIISAATPTVNRLQIHQDKDGEIALLSDLTGFTSGNFLNLSGGTVTGDTIFTQTVSADTIYITTTTEAPLNLPVLATSFTSTTHGDVWISADNSSGNTLFNMVISGVTKSVQIT